MTQKQKKAGILMIVFGSLMLFAILSLLFFKAGRLQGLPDMLPSDETIFYLEFPANPGQEVARKINEILNINWEEKVMPWVSGKSAFALITKSGLTTENSFAPILLIKVEEKEKALQTLLPDAGNNAEFEKNKIYSSNIPEIGPIYFVLKTDTIAISTDEETVRNFEAQQFNSKTQLSNNASFIRIRRNSDAPFFLYANPNKIPKSFYSFIGEYSEQAPFFTFAFPALGIGARKTENGFIGKSYALFSRDISLVQEEPYRAALLPLLPPDPDAVLSGRDLGNQLDKISALIKDNASVPQLDGIFSALTQRYFPAGDSDFANKIKKLAAKEFAVSINQNKVLFVAEIFGNEMQNQTDALRNSFKAGFAQFSPSKRKVILPDGTEAFELFADVSLVKVYDEKFLDTQINGIIAGENSSIFDAVIQNKWFVSNDISTLKKALLLTKEPGLSFRDSSHYKKALQPILKNPELAGVSVLKDFVFGFSKHTFADHMETDFSFVLE